MGRQRDPSGALLVEPSMWQQFTDFANVLKAFIGTSYLALPFAFYQSGLVLGAVGVLVIALITDHCCQLVLKCKNAAVSMVLESTPEYQELQHEQVHEEMARIKAKIEREMTLGDIGQIVVGKWGVRIVNISLVLTQLGFCVAYLIFIGNSIQQMFPLVFHEKPVTTENATRLHFVKLRNISSASISNILDGAQVLIGTTSPEMDLFNSSSMTPPVIGTRAAPKFVLLALIPLPFLILMAYIRKIRLLGPISGIANAALLSGFVGLLVYMLNGLHFKIHDTALANVATFPVFFGQLTGAYEGIGVIIPIESSMENNRPRFKLYLHMAVCQVSVVLGSFGILGYLIYGSNVPQIVTDTLPSGVLAQAIRVTLIIAVLCTYPLQLFPVIEIFEELCFTRVISNTRSHLGEIIAGPSASVMSQSEPLVAGHIPNYQAIDPDPNLDESVVSKGMSNVSVSTRASVDESEILLKQPDLESSGVHYKTSAWKRNVLRTILVLFTAGLAIVLKDDFAYVNALIGSMGSSVLAYILPALCHLMLFKSGSSWGSVIKDVLLVIFGVVGGIMGVVITVQKIVKDFESRS